MSAEPGSLGVREDATDGVAVELEERNLDMGGLWLGWSSGWHREDGWSGDFGLASQLR